MTSVADSHNFSEIQKQAIHAIIRNELKTNDYVTSEAAGSNKGDNYMGEIKRVRAKSSNSNKNQISIIVKIAPTNKLQRDQFLTNVAFLREIIVYEEILPLFEKFQKSKGITEPEVGFYHYPTFYSSIKADMEETLIFEDLNFKGFEMFDRHKDITYDHVKLVMEALGKLHALSFALKDQDFEKLKPYTKLNDIFSLQESFNDWVEMAVNMADDLIKCNDKYTKQFSDMLKTGLTTTLNECLLAFENDKYFVINHGDCWNNNLMFRYDNTKPAEIRLLDWQICRYASPVCDITYYIFCNTTKQLRDKYYREFIDIYYKSLSQFLKLLGSDSEKLFSFDVLQNHLIKYGKFGLCMAVIILPVLTSSSENVPNLEEFSQQISEKTNNFSPIRSENTDIVYTQRLMDIINDMGELGYI